MGIAAPPTSTKLTKGIQNVQPKKEFDTTNDHKQNMVEGNIDKKYKNAKMPNSRQLGYLIN